jgi:hypothetical protein
MTRSLPGFRLRPPGPLRVSARRAPLTAVSAFALLVSAVYACAQTPSSVPSGAAPRSFYIDCSLPDVGDGSLAHPWNMLSLAEAHPFAPGDTIALKRGTRCNGAFAPQGSGTADHIIRLTAYGLGPRPKIVAPSTARQAFLLFNQQYWQADSLDIAGGNTFGVFVTGDKGTLHHLYLKNLYVHDVYGGAFKNKDNGLVVVGPSSINVFFDDVLIDGVDAAHTNQWAGILVGGGSFPYKDDAQRNANVQIRNSTVHDVYGDGIILFRDRESSIKDSAAWLTGMQPTQDVGTPNAIWTWTCYDCTVANNEAYLTDSPGVDGGAFDIDWNDQQNTVANNYAHDTQGYCIAVFAAGYETGSSHVRDNLCIANGLSPRMAVLQGAVYLHTWNGGVIRGLSISHNTVDWDPPVPGAAAIESDATASDPIDFTDNTIRSTSRLIYRISSPWKASNNAYELPDDPIFTVADRHNLSLFALKKMGMEARSSHEPVPQTPEHVPALRIEATLNPELDEDGLLWPTARALLVSLRSLAGQYEPSRLRVTIHLPASSPSDAETNALNDLDSVYPGSLEFVRDGSVIFKKNETRLFGPDGKLIEGWIVYMNDAKFSGTIRELLGPPDYSHMQAPEPAPESAEAPQ